MLALAALLLVALAIVWIERKPIAEDLIARELESLGLPAQYEVVSIGPGEQVVRHLVVGNPARPDLTIEELRVATRIGWGIPGVGRITLVRPRLYGSYAGGRVSFGSLDRVLFGGKGGPFTMPDYDLAVEDGRALIESDLGRFGVKLQGEGSLRGGFAGELAAITPGVLAGGCRIGRTTLYGKLTTQDAGPRFVGPVRTDGIDCAARGLRLARGGVRADVTLDPSLDGLEGKLGLALGPARYGTMRLAGVSGSTRFAYRDGMLSASYTIAVRGLATPQARAARLAFEGRARATDAFAHFDVESDLKGGGIALGDAPDRVLRQAEAAGAGTLLAPIAAQVRTALAREMRGSTIDANVIVRHSHEGFSLVAPRGSLRGGSGASLLAVSRLQALFGKARPRVTGNFTTGGTGLPQAWGRMETDEDGHLALHAAMEDYHAGTARLAVPRLDLAQGPDGALGFTGQVALSGPLPGGQVQNLRAPIDGRWAANGDLTLWHQCTPIAFEGLRVANIAFARRSLTVCPSQGGAVLARRGDVLMVAAGIPVLDLSGTLGATPIRIATGSLGYAQRGESDGVLKAGAIKVTLGPPVGASHFAISRIDARIGREIGGSFEKADLGLYAVPLDLRQTGGQWHYADGALTIDNAHFTLVDRQPVARFQPLVAQGASLRLANNVVTAQALLREPRTQRAIVRADVVHDLASAAGHADLSVDGIQFDDSLQADALSRLALGVVSSLKGQVTGTGRIDWTGRGVTSHGRFGSKGLDFAAAFGPVQGLSGEVTFTDLLGLVTAPNQTLHLAQINPGIAVTDGAVSFQLEPGFLLRVNGAKWAFMRGTLTLDPTTMQMGVAETRRYTLHVAGLDAASFVQHMDTANIAATGTFDGVLPLVFDQNGGRIENGSLISRAPGGSVAYNGALTYKDLSPMANFAFAALRSVKYKRMEIGLGGSLSGEILTRISFDGLSQGATAKRNFVTRQVAKLPIRFILNVKAPFFALFGSMRSLYDASYITDPRALGLLDDKGNRPANVPAPAQTPSANVQHSDSENER